MPFQKQFPLFAPKKKNGKFFRLKKNNSILRILPFSELQGHFYFYYSESFVIGSSKKKKGKEKKIKNYLYYDFFFKKKKEIYVPSTFQY